MYDDNISYLFLFPHNILYIISNCNIASRFIYMQYYDWKYVRIREHSHKGYSYNRGCTVLLK